MVEVLKSNVRGRGVFATQDIPKGTELVCDVFLIKQGEYIGDLTIYTFPWGRLNDSICLGFASFFNHNKNPNVRNFKIDKENLKNTFLTTRDINKGEELFINYGTNGVQFG